MANTLFLRLEGPLQSWGERGRWSVRDTALEPTKSGVIGLIACALGYRDDAQIRPLAEKTRMAVRCDAPGRLITDYHTVGGGSKEPMLLTAQGKPKITQSSGQPHTELTHRDYLCDASFLVVLQSEDTSLIEQMAQGLRNPVWPIYLGRKSCPPSRPVFEGLDDCESLRAALEKGTWSLTVKRPKNSVVRCVLETKKIEGIRRRDHILSRQYRQFGPRYTEDKKITIDVEVNR